MAKEASNSENQINNGLRREEDEEVVEKKFCLEGQLNEAISHWKHSGAGKEISTSPLTQKEPFSLMHLLKPCAYPQGLNTSLVTYLDLNFRLLTLISILILGNVVLMYETRSGYCKYMSKEMEGISCQERFSLYSYLVNDSAVYIKLANNDKELTDFYDFANIGILISQLTICLLPLIYLWSFFEHYKTSLKIKYRTNVRKIENYSLMLTHFRDPQDLERDFEADFESLIQENGFGGECKIVKSVYSSNNVWAQVVEEEAENLEMELTAMRMIEEKYSDIEGYQRAVKDLSTRIKKKEKKLVELREKIKEKEKEVKRTYLLANCVYFVTLSSSLSRDKILRSFKDKHARRCGFCSKNHPKYRITEAADPSNINWKNFGVSRTKVILARVFTAFILALSLIFIPVILGGIVYIANFILGVNNSDNSPEKSKTKTQKYGLIGLYLFLEAYQITAQMLTQALSTIFDVNFLKIELISIQGVSLSILKVLTLIAQNKTLVLGSTRVLDASFIETVFKVILIQSIMKPVMKVFSLGNVLSFIKMSWIRLKFALGSRPLLTQKELNAIFTKPKCYLQNLYCEDIYITSIALFSLDYNPGATVACLIYFVVKTLADRLLFLRFYAEHQIDTIELSKNYFRVLGVMIKLLLLQFASSGIILENNSDPIVSFIQAILVVFSFIQIFVPYEYSIDFISQKLEKRDLINRTEKDGELLELGEERLGLGSDEDGSLGLGGEYYKGASDISSLKKLTGLSVGEVSFMSNRSD